MLVVTTGGVVLEVTRVRRVCGLLEMLGARGEVLLIVLVVVHLRRGVTQ